MEKLQKRIGSTLTILFILLTSTTFAQRPVLSVDDHQVAPDDPITITVSTTLNGTIKVDYPLEFTVDYGLLNGMEQKMDPTSGKIRTNYYIQQSGSFRKPGTYSFYAYVRYKGKNIRSNKVTVVVKEDAVDDSNTGLNSKEPVFGIIQTKKTSVYEGEPLLLKAKVFSELEIYFLEGYSPFKPDKNAEEHVFQNQRYQVEQVRFKGKDMLTFEYGKQLLFPITTGKCKIRPFEMSLKCHGTFFDKTVSFRSSSATITIKPLPDGAPADFIGAVGTYQLKQELGKTTLKQGDVFSLTLVVEGLGNLHNSNPPILNLPAGCSVYGDPERKENIVFTDEGVEGTITYVYNIQVTRSGKIPFAAPSISYFNPATEAYVTVKGEPFTLDVEKNAAFQAIVDSTQPKNGSADVTAGKTDPDKTTDKSNQTALIIGITTPVCLLGLLLFLLFKRKKNGSEQQPEAEHTTGKPSVVIPPLPTRDFWQETLESKDNPGAFSVLLPKAIVFELEKRLGQSGLSREKAFSILSDKHYEEAKELKEIIAICDQFRYGFGDEVLDTSGLLARTKALLDQIR